jgi:xylulokinase
MSRCFLGVDIGTSSTKGVLVAENGWIVATAVRTHTTSNPRPGWFEHDAERVWWHDFVAVTGELLRGFSGSLGAVGVSGIGPVLLPTDVESRPLRPAILYGIDTRASVQVQALTDSFGDDAIVRVGGSSLSSQAVGPKLLWLRECEPEVWQQTRRLHMASSFLVQRLTGRYVLDHHSASQCDPLYDVAARRWHGEWAEMVAPGLELPELAWPGEVAGVVSSAAAELCPVPAGTPVLVGTVDAWAEGLSAGVQAPGDTMLMYGTTLFLVSVTASPLRQRGLWTTVGALPDTWGLAAGLSTGGALATWVRDLTSSPFESLFAEAAGVAPGSDGLLMLPYFAGERTPIFDPDARGVVCGLTLAHRRGHLFRSALESTAFAVRHNLDAYAEAGVQPARLVAVGGGTTGDLWLQIVSDVTGVTQQVPDVTVGASYGDAMLAARAAGAASDPLTWPRIRCSVEPDAQARECYEERYAMFKELYLATRPLAHRLAAGRP